MSFDGGYTAPPTDANLNFLSQEYLYEDIQSSTDGFSASSRLGQGTYGSVYQGTLRDGTEVAVKVLSKPNEAGFREEVEVLSKFRHPNLVILMGFARNSRERYLIYELLPGGDVCARLQKDATFTWRPRLNVALDSSLGLSHLHCARPQVFHRDIKTQNILMDRNGMAKMADFGLALLAQPNCESLTVEHTSGTIGYADPLYIRTGVVTERSEVYSFGMVLLELLTGRPPALQHVSGRIEYQFAHIAGEFSRVSAMLDPRAHIPATLAAGMGQLALQCVSTQDTLRPSFVDIVRQLKQLIREHPEKAPAAAPPPETASAAPATRHGPFLGAGPTPPWAAGAQVRQSVPAQQDERHRERQAAQVGIVAANPNQGGNPAVNLAGHRASASSGGRYGPQDGASAFLLGSRPSAEIGGAANPASRRRPGEPTDLDSRSHGLVSSFSNVGASLYAAADSAANPGAQARSQGGGGMDYVGMFSSPLSGAIVGSHSGRGADVVPARAAERRLPDLEATTLVAPCAPGGGAERRSSEPTGQQHGLMKVLSSGSLVDDSPTCVLDCGSPSLEQGGDADASGCEESRRAGAPGASAQGASPQWVDFRPDPAQGAKPFLLPFAMPPADGGRSRPSPLPQWPQEPMGAGDLGGAVPERPRTAGSASAGINPPRTGEMDQQEAVLQQLQDEMGFSRYQVTEAFKRCSTAEAAIDWILSPEREWAESWGT